MSDDHRPSPGVGDEVLEYRLHAVVRQFDVVDPQDRSVTEETGSRGLRDHLGEVDPRIGLARAVQDSQTSLGFGCLEPLGGIVSRAPDQ